MSYNKKAMPGLAGTELRVTVTGPDADGFFAAESAGGRKVLVQYAAIGDILKVVLIGRGQRCPVARIEEILHSGGGRIRPECPVYFRPGRVLRCGGCDFQHLSYPSQLRLKKTAVESALRRIGGFSRVPVADTAASPSAFRYRNKVQVPFCLRNGKIAAGFYGPYSHNIVDSDDCVIQPELSVNIVRFVKAMAEKNKWSVYDFSSKRGWLKHLFVRTNAEGRAVVAFVTGDFSFRGLDNALSGLTAMFPQVTGILQNVQPESTSVVLGKQWKKLWGSAYMEERLGNLKLLVSPEAFLQVNTPAAEILYSIAADSLREGSRVEEVVDLYSGVGAIAMRVARDFRKVTGIEDNAQAVDCARRNARINKIFNVRFETGRSERLLPEVLKEASGNHVGIVLDPPRYGCHPAVIKNLARFRVRKVVYVSCNPVSFARDAALLAAEGFRLLRVRPVDLFPQTSHVEVVGVFDRIPR